VQQIDHFLRPWVLGFVEVHTAPRVVSAPVVPVLHNVIDGNPPLAVFLRDAEQFVAGRVVLLALPVAISPLTVHRSVARELPVSGDGLVDGRAE